MPISGPGLPTSSAGALMPTSIPGLPTTPDMSDAPSWLMARGVREAAGRLRFRKSDWPPGDSALPSIFAKIPLYALDIAIPSHRERGGFKIPKNGTRMNSAGRVPASNAVRMRSEIKVYVLETTIVPRREPRIYPREQLLREFGFER